MKYRRISLEADVFRYEKDKGFEDGYELWSDVVTKGWIRTDNLIKVKRANGSIECPYIAHSRGRTFIGENDFIIIDSDGTKHVCSADKIFHRYEPIE
jgi:hypothetical protein